MISLHSFRQAVIHTKHVIAGPENKSTFRGTLKKDSEYDQMSQSHTADQPNAPYA